MQTNRTGSKRTAKPLSSQDKSTPSSSLASLKKMSSKSHRPSLSGPMNWLGRSSSSASSSSVPYAPSKPIRISEPQMKSAFDNMAHRSGPLGTGATVVRTPQEALAGPLLETGSMHGIESDHELEQSDDEGEADGGSVYSRMNSPPLPPIPDDDEEETPRTATPSRPSRPPPPAPMEEVEEPSPTSTYAPSAPSPKRPVLKVLDSFPPVPALPLNLPASPPQLPFDPILLSPPPSASADPAKVIVSLETSTATYKTTMKTLMSRFSLISTYLQSLLPPPTSAVEPETPCSRLSEADESFRAMFQQHLSSSGLLLPNCSTLQIFLDRPSAPYTHILAYLRTPPSTPEHPATLPRSVQLLSASSTRLEALLELRDEARYLELDELYKLCTDELRSRQSLGQARSSMHSRAISSASASTSAGSVRSFGLGALREVEDRGERIEPALQPRPKERRKRRSGDSGIASSNSTSGASPRSSVVAEVGWHSVPGLAERSKSAKKYTSLRTAPTAEWI